MLDNMSSCTLGKRLSFIFYLYLLFLSPMAEGAGHGARLATLQAHSGAQTHSKFQKHNDRLLTNFNGDRPPSLNAVLRAQDCLLDNATTYTLLSQVAFTYPIIYAVVYLTHLKHLFRVYVSHTHSTCYLRFHQHVYATSREAISPAAHIPPFHHHIYLNGPTMYAVVPLQKIPLAYPVSAAPSRGSYSNDPAGKAA